MPPTALGRQLSPELELEIVSRFWRKEKCEIRLEDYTSYFRYYHQVCTGLFLGLRSEAAANTLKTHEDILFVIDIVWELLCTRQPCQRASIRSKFPRIVIDREEDTRINNSINLAIRLWLHLQVQEQEFAPAIKTIQWDEETTLQEFVRRQFPGPSFVPSRNGRNDIMDARFTAVNLYAYCGISVKWTGSLVDHLKFDREGKNLTIFSCKQCLQDQIDCGEEVIPHSILRETLMSLDLLFPFFDPQTEKYLSSLHQAFPFTSTTNPARQLCLSDFYYWHDRLTEIYWEFQSPAPGWRQLVQDRRNPLQYYTFWFAVAVLIFTVLFGAISSATAIAQTRYTLEGLQLARAAAASSTCLCST